VAATPPLKATPSTIRFGHVQTITGARWPVIEFCRPKVLLTLHSAQNVFTIGTARIRTNGTFTRPWTPRRSRVGAGRWRLVARQRCESGKDGSTIFRKRSVAIRIR
jgi:hypothetical protein